MDERHDRPKPGFEIADAVRGVFKRRLLVYRTVRRMIGGDEIDHSLSESFDHRLHVLVRAQRRRHFGIGVIRGLRESIERVRLRSVEAHDRLVGESQVMRGYLACNVHTVVLGPPHKLDRARRACVGDMHTPAR